MPRRAEITKRQERIARIAKALGHPVRIAILERLANEDCCYHGDMAKELPVAKSTLSQHLNELKDAGLIHGEIKPPQTRYCIQQANWTVAQELLGSVFKKQGR